MSENPITIHVLPEVPPSVDKSIQNLTDLPTKGIGQTLADCWFLVFGGISKEAEKKRIKYANELKKFEEELKSSISSVPESVRKEPSSQIVLSALDNAKYCVEEKELRDLFTALLTSSIDSNQTVHPSFSYIIARMSPNDAKMLKIFPRQECFPICDIALKSSSSTDFNVLERNVFIDGPDTMSLEEKTLSISSLISLGLLEIPAGLFLVDEGYSRFYESEPFLSFSMRYDRESLFLEKRTVQLSKLGKLFVSCCITKRIYCTTD